MARRPFSGRITDYFGPRIHPISGQASFHTGVDGVGYGNVFPENGILRGYTYDGGYGWKAAIQGESAFHWLAHNRDSFPLVPVGVWQAEDTRASVMGTTGNSTGVHCHWEVFLPDGTRVDPLVWLADRQAATAGGGTRPFPKNKTQETDVEIIIASESGRVAEVGEFTFLEIVGPNAPYEANKDGFDPHREFDVFVNDFTGDPAKNGNPNDSRNWRRVTETAYDFAPVMVERRREQARLAGLFSGSSWVPTDEDLAKIGAAVVVPPAASPAEIAQAVRDEIIAPD